MDSPSESSAPLSGPSRTSGLAIASLVLGILSFGLWILTALPAVICGHLSLSQIKKASGAIGGRGLAVAGLITGYLGLAMGTLIIVSVLLAASKLDGFTAVAKSVQTRADIQAIGTQLRLYESLAGSPPTTEQGLQALVTQPTTEPVPMRWQGPYFQQVPKDPWGSYYIYLYPGRKNPDGYDLYSAGPDRQADTADDNWGN